MSTISTVRVERAGGAATWKSLGVMLVNFEDWKHTHSGLWRRTLASANGWRKSDFGGR